MHDILQKTLFVRDRKRFEYLRERAASLNNYYNGSNILQDDIFDVVRNYATQKGFPLEMLHYPVNDREFCACTFVRVSRIFVVLNTQMELSRQIFATAHELYHIYCFLSEEDKLFSRMGSILKSKTIDEESIEAEDIDANAFAGLFLMPEKQISEQISVYGIDRNRLSWQDVVTLMHIFAAPYKAVVLRLFEEGIITEEIADRFLGVSKSDIEKHMKITGKAMRWNNITSEVAFGSLIENMTLNEESDSLTESRHSSDSKELDLLFKRYGGDNRI